MAKSNLKTINNNNVTQFSNSSIYSKYSYVYYTYRYLNFCMLFSTLIVGFSFFKLIGECTLSKKNIFFSNLSVNLQKAEQSMSYCVSYKCLFINGVYTSIYDYVCFTPQRSLTRAMLDKKIKFFRNFLHTKVS